MRTREAGTATDAALARCKMHRRHGWRNHGSSRGIMTTHRSTSSAQRARALACAVLAAAGLACERASDAGPEPPSGGDTFVLSYATFESTIDPILTARGCDNLSCHGGGIRGTFQLSPEADNDIAFDFDQARMQVNGADPASSMLLIKPLAESAGGEPHAANPEISGFLSTDDPDYQALLQWIEAGEFR